MVRCMASIWQGQGARVYLMHDKLVSNPRKIIEVVPNNSSFKYKNEGICSPSQPLTVVHSQNLENYRFCPVRLG